MLDKWRRVIREACKQSGNPFCIRVHSPLTVSQLIASNHWQNKLCFRAEQNTENVDVMISSAQRSSDLLAVIGPEGGFSETEMREIDHQGAEKLSLSEYILRTETAAIAAVLKLNAIRAK